MIMYPLLPLAGTCIGVGISGLILGGGIGPFTRSAGLTADNVLSAKVGVLSLKGPSLRQGAVFTENTVRDRTDSIGEAATPCGFNINLYLYADFLLLTCLRQCFGTGQSSRQVPRRTRTFSSLSGLEDPSMPSSWSGGSVGVA